MTRAAIITSAALVPAYEERISRFVSSPALPHELWILDLPAVSPTFSLDARGEEWRLSTSEPLLSVLQLSGSADEVRQRLNAHGWQETRARVAHSPSLSSMRVGSMSGSGVRVFSSVEKLSAFLASKWQVTVEISAGSEGRHVEFRVGAAQGVQGVQAIQGILVGGIVPHDGTARLVLFEHGQIATTKTLFPSIH